MIQSTPFFLTLTVITLFTGIHLMTAQTTVTGEYVEAPDQPYIAVPRQGRAVSPAYTVTHTGFSIRQVNVNDEGQNILGDAANEPSIAIDPVNPLRMAIGWRQFDTIVSNFRQAGYAFSIDGGQQWTFPEPIEPGVFRSDPVLDTDLAGNLFYNSLTSSNGNYSCHVFKSSPGETSWDSGTFAYGGDKQWMAVDRTGGNSSGNMYCFWKTGLSSCEPGAFTRSFDNGTSFEPCETFPLDPTRGTLAVGTMGEVYACGGSGDLFAVMVAANAPMAGSSLQWDHAMLLNLGGPLALYNGPNPSGMLGQAWIAVDHSGSTTHGYVYLLATIEPTDTEDPADIVFVKSTDGGQTWSDPLRIHTDAPGHWQWFGSLSVAPNGRLDVTWLDTRNHPGTYWSTLYYAYSVDGGQNWSEETALSEAFDPHLGFPQQNKIGDYYHQVSDDQGVHLAWAATFNGEEDIYYSYIEPDFIPTATSQPAIVRAAWSPNPFQTGTRLTFRLSETAMVRLTIHDATGHQMEVPLYDRLEAGEHTINWHSDLPAGMYSYAMEVNGRIQQSGTLIRME